MRLPRWLTFTRASAQTRASEWRGALVSPPQRRQGPWTWGLEQIRSARDCQLRGDFEAPVRLAEAFRTDDALFTAYQARTATQIAIKLVWRAVESRRGRSAAKRAEELIKAPQHVRESILGTLANHGVAIGYVLQTAVDTPDGPALEYTLTEWPLEHVKYNVGSGILEARTRDSGTVPIVHGDGRWIVFSKYGCAPWTQDACVLPAALLWAAHAECLSDWAGSSFAHGRPKVVGELPEGIRLVDGSGSPTAEAQAFLDMMAALASGDTAAGIRPFGSKVEFLTSNSAAWQVFSELIQNRESAAARIYLGTDAILGSRGGAPGIDVAALFGIATTRIQGDLEALERGFREGLIWPWCAAHGIERADAPGLVYQMPDVDANAKSEQEAAAILRLADSVDALKRSGLTVDQNVVDVLVRTLGVTVPCVLAPEPEPSEVGEAEDAEDPEAPSEAPE